MSLSKKPLLRRLRAAKGRIATLIRDQCINGKQTKPFTSSAAATCGQFIGDASLEQCGLHGTAAAISVLARVNAADDQNILSRLVKYAVCRSDLETQVNSSDADRLRQIAEDKSNVIKVAEVLDALSKVPAGVAPTDEHKRALANSLTHGIINQKGWSYFTDQSAEIPEPLPTAYAILALAHNGLDVSRPVSYLTEHLKSRGMSRSSDGPSSDIPTDIACLYALAFRHSNGIPDDDLAFLREQFDLLWGRIDSMMVDDLEQNIEYWRDRNSKYVRVPWQLYMLALAAKLRFYRRFSGFACQKLLNRTLDQVEGDGFRYPHSGRFISARTNAILFECLSIIERQLEPRALMMPVYWLDAFRRLVGSRLSRGILASFALLIAVYVIVQWFRAQDSQWTDLAPDLIVTLIAWIALSARTSA